MPDKQDQAIVDTISQAAYTDQLEMDLAKSHTLIDMLAGQVIALGGTPRVDLSKDERAPGKAAAQEAASLRAQLASIVNTISSFAALGVVPNGVTSWEEVAREVAIARSNLMDANLGWGTLEKRKLVNANAASLRQLAGRVEVAIERAISSIAAGETAAGLEILDLAAGWIMAVTGASAMQLVDQLAINDSWVAALIAALDKLADSQDDEVAATIVRLLGSPIANEFRGPGVRTDYASTNTAERVKALEDQLTLVSEFSLGEDIMIRLRVQRDGARKWAVYRHGFVLDRQGEFVWEPSPSNMDDEFRADTRWDSLDDAFAAAKAAQEKGNAC